MSENSKGSEAGGGTVVGHTPGPWAVYPSSFVSIGGHRHRYWEIGSESEGVGVCIVLLPDEDDTPQRRVERRHTAMLIRSAPELLEALVACVASLVDAGRDHAPSVALARAAIRSATQEGGTEG